MKISITSNIPVVSTKLLITPALINKALKIAVKKSALLVERYSKMRSPFDTGRLASSINTRIGKFTATVSPTVDYANYVHDGTRYMRARPFMTQGLEDATTEIRSVFNRAIKGVL